MTQVVIWSPQPGPQTALLQCPVFELFYGGARGGGKTDGMIGDWLQHSSLYGENAVGIFVRRNRTQLSEVIARTKQIFPKIGAKYNETKSEWLMPGGARLRFVYLERDSDAENYQGHNYCVALGTPVLMADGTYLPIESVPVGSQVMTLLGPRTVLARVVPYLAPCVEASVLSSDGRVLARQIQPVWHSLASTVELTASHNDDLLQTSPQSPPASNPLDNSVVKSGPYVRPGLPGWTSYSSDGQTYYKEAALRRQGGLPPEPRYFRGVFHVPSLLSELRPEATDLRSFSGSPPSTPQMPHALAHVLFATQITPDSQSRYFVDYDLDDGQPPIHIRTFPDGIPSPIYADKPPPYPSPLLDALDTIPEYTQQNLYEASPVLYHPYTGEVLNPSEQISTATVRMIPCGDSLVCDLTIEGVNHYITASDFINRKQLGFINRNTRVYIEEVTNFPAPGPINKLRATLRGSAGVPVGMRLTGNPGGPGHNWVKARYIDPNKHGYQVIEERETVELSNGTMVSVALERVFIPSRIRDNPRLLDTQPTYLLQLKQTGSEALVRAWLDGDWDMIQGAYFDDFSPDRHVFSSSIILPNHWTRFRAFDWGYAKPFSCGWYAVADGKSLGYPEGALLKYKEFYGWNGTPNEGVRMNAVSVGKAVRERDLEDIREGRRISYGLADPSIFAEDGGPSIAEQMLAGGCQWARADNKRIPGWEQMHTRFQADVPMLYFSDACEHTIRCVSSVQHDENKPEDLDTEGEDHAVDETRYACNSRPIVSKEKLKSNTIVLPKTITSMTFDELVKHNRRKRLEASSTW